MANTQINPIIFTSNTNTINDININNYLIPLNQIITDSEFDNYKIKIKFKYNSNYTFILSKRLYITDDEFYDFYFELKNKYLIVYSPHFKYYINTFTYPYLSIPFLSDYTKSKYSAALAIDTEKILDDQEYYLIIEFKANQWNYIITDLNDNILLSKSFDTFFYKSFSYDQLKNAKIYLTGNSYLLIDPIIYNLKKNEENGLYDEFLYSGSLIYQNDVENLDDYLGVFSFDNTLEMHSKNNILKDNFYIDDINTDNFIFAKNENPDSFYHFETLEKGGTNQLFSFNINVDNLKKINNQINLVLSLEANSASSNNGFIIYIDENDKININTGEGYGNYKTQDIFIFNFDFDNMKVNIYNYEKTYFNKNNSTLPELKLIKTFDIPTTQFKIYFDDSIRINYTDGQYKIYKGFLFKDLSKIYHYIPYLYTNTIYKIFDSNEYNYAIKSFEIYS